MPRLPVDLPAPRQAELDGLFLRARRVRIIEGGAARGRPRGGRVLATFEGPEIEALRAALRIVQDGPQLHCMCHGDLAIDLRGRFLRVGVISYHHGVSIRLERNRSDADLVDGPALLRLLAARGVGEPLARYEAGVVAERAQATAAKRWQACAPPTLRDQLDALASGPMGLSRHESDAAFDEGLAALRSGGASDGALADELLAWLGSSDSPWSGYPAYEEIALVLLRRLAPAAVLAAIGRADDEAGLLGAARMVADHQVVSFRKRMVAAVSPERFEAFAQRLERAAMSAEGMTDARARLQAARGIAAAARERKAKLVVERERELACVAVSEDGPFGELVTDGERLVALDVFTVVDVDVDTGDLVPLVTYTGSPFTELVIVGGALHVLRNNDGRLERLLPGVAEPWIVAEGLARPMQPVACGGVVCMISAPFEQYPGENGIRYSRQQTSLVRMEPDGSPATIVPVERGVASLAADDTHLYFSSTDLEGKGVIERVARCGGEVQRLVDVKANGHALARPRLVVEGEHLVYADGHAVCRVPVAGGRAQKILKLSGPVGAISPVEGGYVAIVGDMSDDEWHVERIGRAGQRSRVGTLERRPYHRLVMVTRRGQAYFAIDERLYRVR
jgi:hypothetical protein